MGVLVVLGLVVVLVLAIRDRRRALAAPLPELAEDYTGPMVVKAPRAARAAGTPPVDVAA